MRDVDIVYAYADWSKEGQSDLHKSVEQQECLKLSLQAWIQQGFGERLVLYADSSILKLIETLGLLNKFKTIHEVSDWSKLFDMKKPFFAYPKMYAMSQASKSTIICDTDMVVFAELFQDFCWDRNYTIPYSFEKDNYLTQKELEILVSGLRRIGGNKSWLQQCCNGGLVYLSEASVSRELAFKVLEIGRKLELENLEYTKHNWVLYEEVLIRPLLQQIVGRDTNFFDPNSWWEGAGYDSDSLTKTLIDLQYPRKRLRQQ